MFFWIRDREAAMAAPVRRSSSMASSMGLALGGLAAAGLLLAAGAAHALPKQESIKGVAKSVENFTDEDMYVSEAPAEAAKAPTRVNFGGWYIGQYISDHYNDGTEDANTDIFINTLAGGAMIDGTYVVGLGLTKYQAHGTSNWIQNGVWQSRTQITEDAWVGALHFSYVLNQYVSFSTTPLFGEVKYQDTQDNFGGTNNVTTDQDIGLLVVPVVVNFDHQIGNFDYGAKLGYTWMRLDERAFTDSAGNRFEEDMVFSRVLRAGGRAGWRIGDFRPNAMFEYSYEFKPAVNATGGNDDRDGWRIGGGIEYSPLPNFSASVELNTLLDHEQLDEWGGLLNFRLTF
jgi:hypothetical protein